MQSDRRCKESRSFVCCLIIKHFRAAIKVYPSPPPPPIPPMNNIFVLVVRNRRQLFPPGCSLGLFVFRNKSKRSCLPERPIVTEKTCRFPPSLVQLALSVDFENVKPTVLMNEGEMQMKWTRYWDCLVDEGSLVDNLVYACTFGIKKTKVITDVASQCT